MSDLQALAGQVRALAVHSQRLESTYHSYVPRLRQLAATLAARSRSSDAAGLLMQAAAAIEAAAREVERAAAQTATAGARTSAYAGFLASGGGGGGGGGAAGGSFGGVFPGLSASDGVARFLTDAELPWAQRRIEHSDMDMKGIEAAAQWSTGGVPGALRDPAIWAPYVNPNSRRAAGLDSDVDNPWRNNCGECAYAAARTIEGQPTCAGGVVLITDDELATALGRQPHMVGSPGRPAPEWARSIASQCELLSEGSYSIVSVGWRNGGGHFFIAYRSSEGVRWLDPQSGIYGDWPPSYSHLCDPEDVRTWTRRRTAEGWTWVE